MMSSVFKIIDLGNIEITHNGKTVALPNDLILHIADEIRNQLRISNGPDVPTPAGPISQPQSSRRNISLLCSIFGHKHMITNSNVANPATCQRCGHETEAINWPNNDG